MSMEIAGIIGASPTQRPMPVESRAQRMPTLTEQAALRAEKQASTQIQSDVNVDALANDLQIVTSALDKRLKFSVNRDLGQVVVKVIDSRTDKVIKELPPEEIQRLHVRLREAIGLLIDVEI